MIDLVMGMAAGAGWLLLCCFCSVVVVVGMAAGAGWLLLCCFCSVVVVVGQPAPAAIVLGFGWLVVVVGRAIQPPQP